MVAYASLVNVFLWLYIACVGMTGNERRSLNGFTAQWGGGGVKSLRLHCSKTTTQFAPRACKIGVITVP